MSIITVEYNDRSYKYTVTKPSILIQDLYETVCIYFKVNKNDYKLIATDKRDNKHNIDRSQPIRLLQYNKLQLVEQKYHSNNVDISIMFNNQLYNLGLLDVNTTLYDILVRLENDYKCKIFDVYSTPPVEKTELFELTINIPGYMQPIIELQQRKYGNIGNGIEQLKNTALDSLGLRSDNNQALKIRMKCTLEYIAPKQTEQQKQQVVQNFAEKFKQRQLEQRLQQQQQTNNQPQPDTDNNQATIRESDMQITTPSVTNNATNNNNESQSQPSAQQLHYDTTVLPLPGQMRTDIPGVTIIAPEQFKTQHNNNDISKYTVQHSSTPHYNNQSRQLTEQQPDIEIPYDRNMRIFYAPPGCVKIEDLPDEYYEHTDEDVAVYARGLLSQMTLSKANHQIVHDIKQAMKPSKSSHNYKYSIIRFRLPNHILIEGYFTVDETTGDMKKFINNILHNNMINNYYLYLTPPKIRLDIDRQTLKSNGLINLCIVHVAINNLQQNSNNNKLDTENGDEHRINVARGIIKDQLLLSIIELPQPQQEQVHNEQKGETNQDNVENDNKMSTT